MKDDRLELISDKIRTGQPVSIREAIEAIEYQESIRKISTWDRLKNWMHWCLTAKKKGRR